MTNKAWHEKNKMPKNPTFEQRMSGILNIIKTALAIQFPIN